jgi:hypothetical protein
VPVGTKPWKQRQGVGQILPILLYFNAASTDNGGKFNLIHRRSIVLIRFYRDSLGKWKRSKFSRSRRLFLSRPGDTNT